MFVNKIQIIVTYQVCVGTGFPQFPYALNPLNRHQSYGTFSNYCRHKGLNKCDTVNASKLWMQYK